VECGSDALLKDKNKTAWLMTHRNRSDVPSFFYKLFLLERRRIAAFPLQISFERGRARKAVFLTSVRKVGKYVICFKHYPKQIEFKELKKT